MRFSITKIYYFLEHNMNSNLRNIWILSSLFVIALVFSVVFASKGVIRQDKERNIFIPEELLINLKVKAAYNEDQIFWNFEWEADPPSYYHDVLVYEDGKWIKHGRSSVGPEPERLYEDRLSFFLDDGRVEYFEPYGGFITVAHDMRFMTDDVPEAEAQKYLGKKDVRKFLPETRTDPHNWRTIRSKEELSILEEGGYFLDLWHWRAHRSNPIGYADDQHVNWYRLGDKGKAPYFSNWDAKKQQPKFMYNPELMGRPALRWDKLQDRGYTQKDHYFLSSESAVPFDSTADWQEGDVIPNQVLRSPTESRGSIKANGFWEGGKWKVILSRALDTKDLQNDKTLKHLGKYTVAFAVHKNATGSRWHYISYPISIGLGRQADITAQRFSDTSPPWEAIPWTEIPLIYPGQISWDHVMSPAHAGYESMKKGIPLRSAHSPKSLSIYAVESEFREEIKWQWFYTWLTWTALYIALIWSVVRQAINFTEENP